MSDLAYIHRDPNHSNTLLVWFGGHNEPFLSENVCHATGADLLSIKDERQDWYTSGVVGIGNRSDVLNFLKTSMTRYERVFFAGQSSGGYGALSFAYDCEPTACFAFSPTVRNLNHVPPMYIEDMGELYRETGVKFPIVLNVGRSEKNNDTPERFDDFQQIKVLRELDGVTTIIHPVDVHYVTVPLHREKRFYPLLAGLMAAYG